jgi:ketosteroid isomerase-like protein
MFLSMDIGRLGNGDTLQGGGEGGMTTVMATTEATRLLERFGDAWNRHDLEAMMECMADDDCVYLASFGLDEDGTPFVGREAVREGFARYLASFPDGRYEDTRIFVADDRAATEWTFIHTGPDGIEKRVRGCDLFELRDGKIFKKDAFRKDHRAWK